MPVSQGHLETQVGKVGGKGYNLPYLGSASQNSNNQG